MMDRKWILRGIFLRVVRIHFALVGETKLDQDQNSPAACCSSIEVKRHYRPPSPTTTTVVMDDEFLNGQGTRSRETPY